MQYKVIRPNTSLNIGDNSYATGDVFEAKREDVKTFLKNNYIKEVKDGKATI